MTCNCIDLVSPTYSVGKLERNNPLPAGQYWIDVVGLKAQEHFAAWRFENKDALLILVYENYDAQGDFPARDWVKFEVKTPVPWNAVQLGFPNIIEPEDSIDTSSDTATNPTNEEIGVCDIACQVEKVGWVVGGVLVLGLLVSVVKR